MGSRGTGLGWDGMGRGWDDTGYIVGWGRICWNCMLLDGMGVGWDAMGSDGGTGSDGMG